ncbi:MAG: VOC family protein [Acidimicrobiales bacterium]
MIKGAHVIIYSSDADADRAFFLDVLEYPHVDAGNGRLFFKLPPAEIAVHATEGEPSHEMFLVCDDLKATIDDLESKGVEVVKPPSDQGWGIMSVIRLPGGSELGLYQPRHPLAFDL